MRHRLVLLVALSLPGLSFAQQVKDPAELMPAKVLAYLEIRQPGPLAKEIASLFEGSVLGNVPDSLAKLRSGDGKVPEELGIVGAIMSPELIRELGRIQGAAVALLGPPMPPEKDMPEFVAVVLPGDSNVPGFATRMLLVAHRQGFSNSDGRTRTQGSTSFEVVSEVEGVKLYRQVERRTTTPLGPGGAPAGPPGKTETRETGPMIAMTPSALVVGTPISVRDAIVRLKGRGKDPALASIADFQQARGQLANAPGFFQYGDMGALVSAIEQQPGIPPRDRQMMTLMRDVLNPKAVRGTAGSLTLQNGALSYRAQLRLNPAEKSPILDILPTTAVPMELLQFAPKDGMVAAALANADGEKRFARAVELADQIAKAVEPNSPPPSQQLAQIEGALGLSIGKDVFGKVQGIAFAMPGVRQIMEMKPDKPGPGIPPFALIVQAADDKAAESLAKDVLPKLVAMISRQEGSKPVEKEVGGQRLSIFEAPGVGTICYGRLGNTLVVGPDAAFVAESLNNGKNKRGLASDARLVAALKSLESPVALATLKAFTAGATFWVRESQADSKPDKTVQELLAILDKEEPVLLAVSRKPDHVQIEARFTNLKAVVPKFVDLLIEQKLHESVRPAVRSPQASPGR